LDPRRARRAIVRSIQGMTVSPIRRQAAAARLAPAPASDLAPEELRASLAERAAAVRRGSAAAEPMILVPPVQVVAGASSPRAQDHAAPAMEIREIQSLPTL
jgi:hypothetical protein